MIMLRRWLSEIDRRQPTYSVSHQYPGCLSAALEA